LNEVLSDASDDVGVCRARILDLVDRNFRRILCGSMTGIEGHEKGSFETEKKRSVESSPPAREKYWVGIDVVGAWRGEMVR